MGHKRMKKYFSAAAILFLSTGFVIKFAGPSLLRQYVTYGIGSCKDIPILCMQPNDYVFSPQIDTDYKETLIRQVFPKLSISAPKGFTLIQELIKKQYYKKKRNNHKAVIYLLHQEPQTFIKLYPDVRKQGISNNRLFIERLMHSDLDKINDITAAFFTIMKSVFTPDIGNQNIAKMIRFKIGDLEGFINYTMARQDNYFDCNILDPEDNFFKIYIKDAGSRLDLNKVFTIISTIKPAQ